MSDRPSQKAPSDEPSAGGWRVSDPGRSAPGETESAVLSPSQETRSAGSDGGSQWRAPAVGQPLTPTPAAPQRQAWRIPTLPRELNSEPQQAGGWHRPQRTLVTEEDESVVLSESAPSADAVPVEVTEGEPLPHEALQAEAPISQVEADAGVLPFEEQTEAETAGEEQTGAPEEDEDDEEDRFSMSQLVALASLAEKAPAVAVEEEGAARDAAEYARQQLERLRAAQGEAAPAAGAAPPSGEVALNADEQEELARFREAEARILALRERYRAGEMSADDLRAALKKEMVLDSNNSWWMMGVESDRWYHHVADKWQVETPPVLEKAARAGAGVRAAAAPDIGAATEVTAEMPLPRMVPTRDLDATIVGTEGMYLDPNLQATVANLPITGDMTVPMGAYSAESSAPTIAAPAIGGEYVPPVSVPAPVLPGLPSYDEVAQNQQRKTLRLAAIIAAVGVGALLLLGACGVILIATTYNGIVQPFQTQIAGLADYRPAFQTARIYAADNSIIATLTDQGDRVPVTLENISPYFVHALLAIEDPDFYDSAGYSPFAVAGGILQNVFGGGVQTSGGITEQIACALILQDCSDTPQNRLRIFAVSTELARIYEPNFLLNLYVNEAFFGNQSYGVQSAGRFYFNTDAINLNAAQSALLAGLIAGPATYDPINNRQAAFDRMNAVLRRQAEVGCIRFGYAPYLSGPFCFEQGFLASGEMAVQKARVEASDFMPRSNNERYPHFVNYVKAQLEQAYGSTDIYQRGFQIYTTLVPRVQDAAQSALAAALNGVAPRGVNNGAVLVVDPVAGAIRAMIGSPNFNDANIQGEVNNVFTWNPAGEAIFPVIYAGALEGVTNAQTGAYEYMTPATTLWNVPTVFSSQPPFAASNPNGVYTGPTAIRYALGNSYSVTAARAYAFLGDQNFVNVSNRMGINYLPEAVFGPQAALGSNSVRLYDLVEAYATLANNGVRVPFSAIMRITDSAGQDVPVPGAGAGSQQVQPQIAFLLNSILADDAARAQTYGLNSALNIPAYAGNLAARAGASSGAADLWTLGYTSSQVVGVWMGSTNNGATTANPQMASMPVWNAIMQAALAGTSPRFVQPPGIVQAQVCSLTGALYDQAVSQNCGSVRTEFFSQNMPPLSADQGFVRTITIDTWSGQQANQYCPDNTTTSRFLSVPDSSAQQWLQTAAGIAWLQQNGLSGMNVGQQPSACGINTQNPILSISAPASGQAVQGVVTVTGTVQAANLQQYTIELAPQAQPTSFVVISGPSTQPMQNGVLGSFDSTRIANGGYILRLAVYNSSGGYAYRTAQIVVNNPVPTATPQVFPTQPPFFPTQPPFFPTQPPFFPTTLPFDQPTPTISFGS